MKPPFDADLVLVLYLHANTFAKGNDENMTVNSPDLNLVVVQCTAGPL